MFKHPTQNLKHSHRKDTMKHRCRREPYLYANRCASSVQQIKSARTTLEDELEEDKPDSMRDPDLTNQVVDLTIGPNQILKN